MTDEIKSALELALEKTITQDGRKSIIYSLKEKIPEMIFLQDAIRELRKDLGIVRLDSTDEKEIPDDKKISYGILLGLEAVSEAYQRKLAREAVMNTRPPIPKTKNLIGEPERLGQYL
ncbi:hypothetical protein HYX19_04910 [Candidatus Woesearchaeota archaeon]|nr:hypothetical protein [Candidatus Woesearchaeota archaeon]